MQVRSFSYRLEDLSGILSTHIKRKKIKPGMAAFLEGKIRRVLMNSKFKKGSYLFKRK